MDPLPFSTIRDYRNKAIELNPTYADLSINDFSDLFNRATGSQAFDAGLGSGFENAVKSYSAGADDLLEKYASPVQDALGEAGAKLFGAFKRFGADPEVGRQVGKESLRSVVDFAPVIAGTALSFVPGLQAAGPVGLAATAALTGANAYEKSDSLAQTALAAGMVFAGGPLTRAGGSAALGAVRGAAAKSPVLKALGIEGGSLVAGKHILADGSEIAVERLIAQKVGDRVLGLVAGETAINATSMLGSSAVELFETGEMSNPFTADNLLSNLVDPTLIFGVEELIRPTALMTRRIEESKANNDIVNASTEEAAKRVAQVTPTPVGTTLAELVNKRSEALARIESLPENQRKEARVAVEELYAKAIGDEASLDRSDAGELFGRSIEQALSDEKTKPLSEPVMMEDGSVGQKPITLEEVLDAEWARSGLTIDVARATGLSDDALLKLIEAEDRPRTREEYVQQIDKLNVVREEMGEELIDNEKLKSIVEDEVAKGSSLEDAVEAANEIVTTETQNKVARKGRIDYVKLFSKGEGAEYQAGLAAAKEFEKSGLDLETTLDQLEAAGRIPGELGSDERTNFKRGLREYSSKMAALKEERKIKAARAGARSKGRPKKDAVTAEDIPILEVEGQLRELSKGEGPEADLAKNEIAVYDEALATIMKGKPRDRAQVYLAAVLKKYLDKKAKGELTDKGGTVAATPEQYAEILKRMLSPSVKDSQVSSVKWENVRKSKDSPLNMKFPTEADADLGVKMLSQDHPDKEFKYLKSGNGYKITWKQSDVKMTKEQSVAEVLYWDPKGVEKTVDEKQGVEARNEAFEDKIREMYGEDEETLNALLAWGRENPEEAKKRLDGWLEMEQKLQDSYKTGLKNTDDYSYEELDDSFVNYDPVTGEELDDGLGSAFLDEQFLRLAMRPEKNITELTELVESAANKNGPVLKVYHGSPNKGFTTFKLNRPREHDWSLSTGNAVHFSDGTDTAQGYRDKEEPGYDDVQEGEIRSFFIPNKLLKVGLNKDTTWFEKEDGTKFGEVKRNFNRVDDSEVYPDIEIINNATKAFVQSLGYDGLYFNWNSVLGNEYAIFDTKKIKSADPVTYDENGEVIPLSKRFDLSIDDIRYSGKPQLNVTPERQQKRIKEYTRVFGNTAREAMSAVAGPKDYVSDLARVVMDNFGKLTGRKLEDVKIEYTTNTRSFADSRRISFGTGNVDTPDLTDRQIMLHEFLHIASVGAIDKVGDPNVSSKLSGKEHTQYWLDRVKDLPEGDAVRDLVILWNHARKASGIHPSMSGELTIGDYHARRAHGSNPENKIDFDVAYGLMSPHEFLAQAFSSDKMKQFLDVVTVPDGMRTDATVPKTSIFNAIVNAIAKLFGIDRNDARLSTALTETLNVGIRMSQESVVGTRRSTERSAPEYVSPKDVTERILVKSGMKLDAVEAAHPVMEKLYNTFGASNDIEVGIMLDDARGAATITGLARRLYLGDKGLHEVDDATKIKALAFTAGHEMSHLTEQLFNNGLLTRKQHDKFSKFEEWTRKADANERKLALEIMSENLPKDLKDSDFIKVAMSSTNKPEEVRANLMAMWAMTQLEAPDQTAVNLLPREVLKGMNVLTDMARRVYGAMKGTTYALPKYMQNRPVRERIDNMVKFMEGLKDAHNKSEDFYTEGRNLLRVGPESRDIAGALRMFDGPDGPELNVPNDKRGVGRRLFDKWITQTDQLAKMVPSFGPIIADLHNFVGDTKAMSKRTVGNVTGELDDAGNPVFQSRTDKLRYEMVRDDAKLNKLASDWMRLMNETKNDLNGRGKFIELADLSAADKDLADRFGSLSPKEREAIDQVVKRYADAMKQHNGEALRTIAKTAEASIQAYISSKRPDLWKDSAGIAKLLHDSVRAFGTQADVAGVAMAKENFAKVASLLSPTELQNAMKLSQAGIDAQVKMSDMFMRSPVFFSEIRVGKYFLHYKAPNGETGGEAFDDMKDLRRRSEQLDKQGYTAFNVEEGRKGQPHMVNDKLLNFIAEHDEFSKKLIDELDLSDEQKDNIKAHFTYAAELKRALAAQEVVKVGSQRKMKPGRETLDMLSTQIAYFNASSRAMNRRVLQYRLSHHFANPEFKNELVAAHVPELKQQIENFFVPDTELGTQIAVANASYFLGMNMSSMLVEGAQPLFSYIPEMQSMGMSYVQAMKTVTKAQAQVAKYTLRNIPSAIAHKARKNSGVRKTEKMEFWDNPEHIELMNYAAQNDWISLTHANDVVEPDMSSNADLSGIVGRKGEKQQSALSKYGITPVKHFARMSLKVYQQSTEFNARVALLSGYEIARKNGMDPKAAREEAGKFARTVTFSGGKLNRPNALFSGAGPVPRTVGQALYSLNGYTFGMLSMMRRYAETAFSKEQYPGITEADRKNARKALTTMVSTQFLGAGALGMPFVAAGIKLLEQITGQELEREAREGLAELFDEDEREDGGLLSDIVMHGAANALAGKVLPGAPDIGSRFAIGGIMGVNSYDGYSLSALVGPTGSVVENVVNGVTNAAQGNGAQAFQDIVPVAWKKVLEMMKHDGEFVTPSGELLAEGTKGEKLAYSMGFAPQRIRKMKNYERLQRQHEEVVRQRDIRTHDELAEMFSEDPVRARQELDKIVKDSPRVQEALKLGDPEMIQRAFESQIQDSATKIAERIERRTHARDPRRAGTFNSMSGEQTLLAAMGQTGAPSEVARLQTRATVQAQLGVQPSMSERAMSRAQIIDQIMARSPATPKAQAAAIADQILAGS